MFSELSIVKGWPDTVAALQQWREGRFRVLLPWVAISLLVALALLGLTLLIGLMSQPDPSPTRGLPADMARKPGEYLQHILRGNFLVLALHACSCFAGYVVHVALPDADHQVSGAMLGVQRSIGRLAIVFVPAATAFSIVTQSWVLGSRLSDLALQLNVSQQVLLVTILPHAIPELTAVFLPLAAWIATSRTREWNDLIAATLLSVAIAAPVIVGAAVLEVRTWPPRVVNAQQAHLNNRYVGFFRPSSGAADTDVVLGKRTVRERFTDQGSAAIAAARESKSVAGRSAVALVEVGSTWLVYDLATADASRFREHGGGVPGLLAPTGAFRLGSGSLVYTTWKASRAGRGSLPLVEFAVPAVFQDGTAYWMDRSAFVTCLRRDEPESTQPGAAPSTDRLGWCEDPFAMKLAPEGPAMRSGRIVRACGDAVGRGMARAECIEQYAGGSGDAGR